MKSYHVSLELAQSGNKTIGVVILQGVFKISHFPKKFYHLNKSKSLYHFIIIYMILTIWLIFWLFKGWNLISFGCRLAWWYLIISYLNSNEYQYHHDIEQKFSLRPLWIRINQMIDFKPVFSCICRDRTIHYEMIWIRTSFWKTFIVKSVD